MKEKHLCHKCKKDFDELYGKGLFLGNKDDNFYCVKCYKKVFKEDFNENLPPRDEDVLVHDE